MQHSVQYLPHIQTEVSQNTYPLAWNGLKYVLKMSDMGYSESKLGVKKIGFRQIRKLCKMSTEDW